MPKNLYILEYLHSHLLAATIRVPPMASAITHPIGGIYCFGKGNTPTLNKIYFSRACEILMIKSPIRSNSEIVSR